MNNGCRDEDVLLDVWSYKIGQDKEHNKLSREKVEATLIEDKRSMIEQRRAPNALVRRYAMTNIQGYVRSTARQSTHMAKSRDF